MRQTMLKKGLAVLAALLLPLTATVAAPTGAYGASSVAFAAAWAPWTAYTAGTRVTYNGVDYECVQSHTSQPGWEPPNVPALWKPVTGGGTDTTAPSVPGNLRSTGTTSSSVSLAWDAATDNVGVTGYDVYRGSTRVTTVTGTSYTDSGLAAATSYTYTVRARDAAGNVSAAGNSVTATTSGGTGAPGQPGTPSVTGSTGSSIALSWGASSGTVTGYRVYEGSAVKATVTGTSATIGSLGACTSHTYTVKAYNSVGESAASGQVTGATTGCTGGGNKVLGYFIQWGVYQRSYHVKNIDTSGSAAKLTHINYAFGNVTNGQCAIGDTYADYDKALHRRASAWTASPTPGTPARCAATSTSCASSRRSTRT